MFEGSNLVCARGGRLVFADVHFTLRPGDALLVTGPNGSGKSSLLRLMAGLLAVIRGRLAWNGVPIEEDPEAFHRKLHYCGHLDAIKPTLTVAENLSFSIELRGGGPSRLSSALDAFGLAELRDLPARLLSAGQRRRLGLARLMAVPAPLWLLDEPTIALDAASVATLHDAIRSHRANGGIAVVATNVPMGVDRPKRLELGLEEAGDDEESFWS